MIFRISENGFELKLKVIILLIFVLFLKVKFVIGREFERNSYL